MKQTGYMLLKVELENQAYIEMEGPAVKYWKSYGLPTFEGDMDTFAETYPAVIQELLKVGAIKQKP